MIRAEFAPVNRRKLCTKSLDLEDVDEGDCFFTFATVPRTADQDGADSASPGAGAIYSVQKSKSQSIDGEDYDWSASLSERPSLDCGDNQWGTWLFDPCGQSGVARETAYAQLIPHPEKQRALSPLTEQRAFCRRNLFSVLSA